MKKKLRAAVYTLGCRVNQYESDVIAQELSNKGFEIVSIDESWDIAVINTCTVTMESDHKSRKSIRRAASKNPDGAIIVTGCFAQVSPKDAAAVPNVSIVCANNEKELIPDIALELCTKGTLYNSNTEETPDIMSACYDSLSLERARRQRSYIKIEDGCENKCAYCIIPRARGKVRSKAPESVLSEVSRIAKNGCPEIILTGIETASYGKDFENGYRLVDLIRDVCKVDGIERITLGSLEPTALREDLILAAADSEGKVLPHFHLSMQSGCDKILNKMRRRYNTETVLQLMNKARALIPEVTFSADIIVGFPGETEEDFSKTVNFCKYAKFLHLHIFPYSKRKGTEAAEMPDQLTSAEKKGRVRILSDIQKEIKKDLLCEYIKAHAKSPVYVLAEEMHGNMMFGHSEHFAEMLIRDIKEPANIAGRIIPVIPEALDEGLEVICRRFSE